MHTHIHMHVFAHLHTDRKSQQQRLNTSSNIIDAHTHSYTYACIYTYICTYIYAHPAASVSQMCTLMLKNYFLNVYTCTCTGGAQNTCSKLHATLNAKKNAHIYILTHICIRIHMHTNTHAHAWHCPHAEALILRPTIYPQICIHIHIHMYINTYIYIYIHDCIYTHIYMSAHMHTYTYIHAHIQKLHMHARKHAWNDGTAATAREARLDTKKLRPSPPRENRNPEGGHPPQRAVQLSHSRRTTGKWRTTTIDSSSSHHHDSAPSRPHLLLCTGAEPIHPVHGAPKLPSWPWPPETRSFSCHFGASFYNSLERIDPQSRGLSWINQETKTTTTRKVQTHFWK